MPNEEKITYKVGSEVYDIPISEKAGFLNEFKNAVEVKSFIVGKDTFDIPIKEVDSFLKDVPDAKPLSLGKPSAAPQPGGGGGLSSPKAPGMDGGRSPFGMGSVAQKIGQPPIAQEPTIPPSEFGITSVGGKIGKPMPAQPIDKGMAEMPTVEGPQKYDLSGLPSMKQSSRQGDINAMMPEIKLSVPPETMEMKPSGKLVYNPLKDYQRRTEEIEKEADVDRQTIKKKELWEDVAKYSQEDNKEIENFLTQSLPQMQQMQADFDNVAQALQDPQLPEDQRNALEMQAEELQGVLQNNATEMQKMEAKYKSNAALSAQLLKASKGLKYNDATPLEIVSKEVWNGTVPAIIKSVGGLLEAGGKAPGGMPSLIDPETGEIINPTFLQSVGSALITGANDMQAEYQSTDSDVSVLDDLNAANISKLAGSVLSSFAIAAGTGGLGAAPQAIAIGGQIFGNTYEQAKEAGLTPEQAAAFAIIPTLVGAKLAPYGVESVAAKLLNPSSKAALKEAIKSVGKQGGAKKALELGKEWAKNVLIEGTTGATEAAVQYGEEVAFQQLPNVDFGNDETLQGFARAIQEGFATEAAGGGALGLFLTVAPRKKLSDIASSAIKDPAKETKFFDDLKSLLDNNDINQQQFDAVSDFYQKAKAAAAQVPPTVTNPQQSARATELIQEQQELQAQIEQTNPAMVAPLQSRLKEVDSELGDIAEASMRDIGQVSEPVEAKPKKIKTIAEIVAETKEKAARGERLEAAKQRFKEAQERGEAIRLQAEKDAAEQIRLQREARDKEVAEIEKIRPDLTDEDMLLVGLPPIIEKIQDRMDANISSDPVQVQEAIDALDKKFDELEAYKKDPKRTHTTEQIDEVIDLLSDAKSEIQLYQEQLAGYEREQTPTQQAARAAEQQPAAERKPEAAPAAEGTRVQAAPELPAITAADFEATDKTGKAGRKARQQIREQYGTDTAAKMEYITKNFEEAITNLEKQGKIRKICP
jgi:hypothetical protein